MEVFIVLEGQHPFLFPFVVGIFFPFVIQLFSFVHSPLAVRQVFFFSRTITYLFPIYIPSSFSLILLSWLLNQCLKCVSRVLLAQHRSIASSSKTRARVRVCLSFSVSLCTYTHPSICPISTCAEAQPPGKLTVKRLPEPSVAISSFNSTLTPLSRFPSCRAQHLLIALIAVNRSVFI